MKQNFLTYKNGSGPQEMSDFLFVCYYEKGLMNDGQFEQKETEKRGKKSRTVVTEDQMCSVISKKEGKGKDMNFLRQFQSMERTTGAFLAGRAAFAVKGFSHQTTSCLHIPVNGLFD